MKKNHRYKVGDKVRLSDKCEKSFQFMSVKEMKILTGVMTIERVDRIPVGGNPQFQAVFIVGLPILLDEDDLESVVDGLPFDLEHARQYLTRCGYEAEQHELILRQKIEAGEHHSFS